MTKIERVSRESLNLVQERYQRLKELFPEIFTEGKIDFTKLRATFGDLIDDRPERYLFTWAGKTEAIKSLQTSSWATLIPCPEESIDFDKANHIFIEGENLEVLKLLLKPYFGRVKMIYIDPPYNRGGEFIYRDDYKQPLDAYLKQTGQIDGNGNHMTSKLETNGRYHSAWLSMMYPRLFLARQLLKEEGIIVVSIDDKEVANLKLLMNEVFGEENFIAQITVLSNPRGRQLEKYVATSHEYLILYAKNEDRVEVFHADLTEAQISEYKYEDEHGRKYRLLGLRKRGKYSRKVDRPNLHYPIYVNPKTGEISIEPLGNECEVIIPKLSDGTDGVWRWSKSKVQRNIHLLEARMVSGRNEWDIFQRDYLVEDGQEKKTMYKSVWTNKEFNYEKGKEVLKEIFGEALFDAPKPVELLKQIINMTVGEEDIVLDFFAGSGTTAQAVLELNAEDEGNRQFIIVQLPEPTPEDSLARKAGFETISAVCKERIRRVIRGYGDDPKPMEGVGFKVFKLAPSNFKQWEDYTGNNPDEYLEQLSLFQTTLVDDYRNIDVIYEVILKEGYDLNSQIEQVENVTGNTVFRITDPVRDQFFYLCLDKQIHLEALEPLSLKEDDLFICLDTALDDTTKANLALQCRLKTI